MEPAFYVTTPIYYISGTPHVGHAYTTIAADILARTARAWDGDARSLTGTDEHGQKVAQAAAAAGRTPQDYVDELAPKWRALGPAFDALFSDFIRTTERRHHAACLAMFEKMQANGDIYRGTYEGWYCTNDETFWPEAKLIDGRCPNPECRRSVEWLAEDNWFFRLSKYRDRLVAHFAANPEFLRPQSAYNEMMRTLEGGLDDLSISRSTFDWGIPLPGGGVLYVWFDALINYVSALGYPDETGLMARYWPGMHLIGKEIARFHTLIWPAMLWAAGLEAPARVFAHGWIITEGGEKMSKSLGNALEPFALVEAFGADAVRYFLFREAPFGSDFTISVEKLRQRHNSDLGNDLGNLLNRSLAMLARYRDGRVPAAPPASELAVRYAGLGALVHEHVLALRFREALDAIWELVTALNRAIEEQKPWELHKQGRAAELDALLYDLCAGLRLVALAAHPFMPAKAAEMWRQLGLGGSPEDGTWAATMRWDALEPGTQTAPGSPLFPRLEAPAAPL